MPIIVFRLFPHVTGILAFVAGLWQWQTFSQGTYPFPLIAFIVWDVCALFWITNNRMKWRDRLEKILPSVLVLLSLSLGFLMVENAIGRIIVMALFVFIPALILELLFLFLFATPRYPVGSISHVNIAIVPIGAFFLSSTLVGLWTFVRMPWWVLLFPLPSYIAILYYLTGHPSSSLNIRLRWAILGAFIGIQISLISLLLPVAMFVHGAFSALLVSLPLRWRRYTYEPKPSRKVAMFELISFIFAFVAIVGTSRWL